MVTPTAVPFPVPRQNRVLACLGFHRLYEADETKWGSTFNTSAFIVHRQLTNDRVAIACGVTTERGGASGPQH